MRKLIRKCQLGANVGNIGAEDQKKMWDFYFTSQGYNKKPTNALGIDWSSNSAEIQRAKNMIAGPEQDPMEALNAIGGGTQKFTPKQGFFKNMFNNMGGTSGLVSLGANIGNSLLPKRITSKATDTINGVFDIAKNIPGPIGMYATAGQFLFNAVDSLGASKLATLNKNQDTEDALARTGGGYGDFMADWDAASALSGQNAGLFTSKSALNNKIWDANRQMSVLQQIMGNKKNNELLTAQMGDRWNERTMMDMNGGLGNISFGRLGLKIEILDKVHAIMSKPKVVDSLTEFQEEVPEFKEGGKMNVIPEGSLHARLHHMENADGLTKKGIPVVSIAEGGELEQQAEIELNEIIFRLEVTQELEKLMEDGSDNAAIEAGKLLVKEIFENTDDRTGLLKQLEPEKKEPTTEDIVKNHQVF